MKTRNLVIALLFDAVKSTKPLSEQKLLEVKSLINEIPNLAQTRRQEIAIYQRIKQNNPEVKIAIPEEITVNDIDSNNSNTLLILAASNGHREVVHELIEAKADLDIQNKPRNTALHYAILNSRQEIANKLIEAKAYLEIRDDRTNTALIIAASNGRQETTQKLIEAKANLDAHNYLGETALLRATSKCHKEVAFKLIEAKANLDIQEKNEGQTPLIRAALDGHQEIVRKLVTAKASLDIRDNAHNTALMYAAAKGYRESVHALIEGKANIDNQGHHNATALMFAIEWNHHEIAQDLIHAGARLEFIHKNGDTALDRATRDRKDLDKNKKFETVSLLLHKGATIRNPQQLFDFLGTCNQGNPYILVSLNYLSKQLRFRLIKDGEEKQFETTFKLFTTTQNYVEKLEKLTAIHRELLVKELHQVKHNMPAPLVDIVVQYSAPLEDPGIRLFKPTEIDTLLPEPEQKKQKSSSKTKQSKKR